MRVLEDWHISIIDDIIKSVLCFTIIYASFLLSLTGTKRAGFPTVLHGHSNYLHLYFLSVDRHDVENRLKRMPDPYPLIRCTVALYDTIYLGILHKMRPFSRYLISPIIASRWSKLDRLGDLVVRVSGYRYRGPGFDPRRYQIFWVAVGLKRGPLSLVSLVRSIEELLEWIK